MAINEQPPKSTPPTSTPPTSTPPTEGYACTARNNRIAFENDAKSGRYANKNPDASAEAYNKLFQRIYEEAVDEDKSGMCNPSSTTPNPKYIPTGDLSKMLEETSKRGLNLKYKPDGSLDLSDPDTMQAVVNMGKEGVRVAEGELNKNKPPDESKSGSGSGGGGSGGGSGGGMPAGMTGSGGGTGGGSGGGSGGGQPPPQPQEPAKTDSEKEAAKQKCLDTINQLNSAIGNAYVALNRDAQILAEPSMAALGSINAGAIDACTKASQLQDVLNRVVAAGQAVATGGQGGAVQTETVNPITGNVVKQTAWYDPKTGDCVTQTDTLSNTGAASSVVATTKPTGQTTAVNVPPAGNPNTTVDPKTGKTQSGLTPAGASNPTNWGNLLFWGAVGLVGVTILNGGGGKKR